MDVIDYYFVVESISTAITHIKSIPFRCLNHDFRSKQRYPKPALLRSISSIPGTDVGVVLFEGF